LGLSLSAIAYILLIQSQQFYWVYWVFALLGIGMGFMNSPILVALSRFENPGQAFGMVITATVLFAGFAVYIIPAWLLPVYGFSGMVIFLLVSSLSLLPLIRFMPAGDINESSTNPASQTEDDQTRPLLPWICLLGVVIFFVGINSNWVFFEIIGSSKGLNSHQIGISLTLSLIVGALGSLTASVLSNRISISHAMLISVGLFLIAVGVFQLETSAFNFGIGLLVFNIAWNFCMPFQLHALSKVDHSGRYVALLPAAQTLGAALGPLLGGTLYLTAGANGLLTELMICVLISCLIFVWIDTQRSLTATSRSRHYFRLFFRVK